MKKYLISILGQSNEAGPGPTSITTNGVLGCPNLATNNQMWPRLAGLLGKRNIWAEFNNKAVGATNLTDVWVGRARNYTNNMLVINGCYVISGGRIYKAVGGYGYVCVQPSPPPAAPTPSGSNTFTWTDLGPVTADDTDGKIYSEGSARFDPNGLIAGIISSTQARVGFDEKWLFVSIGQGDKTMESTRAQYGDAMRIVANYFTSRGYRVFLGFTCYSATSDPQLWYDTYLLPGRLDALTTLSGNPLVHAGANLRAALGVLPVYPSVTTYGGGLRADSVHLNPISMADAANAWDSHLASLGW